MMKEFFFTIMLILVLFNLNVAIINNDYANTLGIGVLTTFVGGIILVIVAMGFQFSIIDSGWSFSESSITYLISIGMIFMVLFRVDIPAIGGKTLPLGIGLYSTVIDIFATNDFFGLGNMIIYIIGITAFLSGMFAVTE